MTTAVAERGPLPCLTLHPNDAAKLRLADGDGAAIGDDDDGNSAGTKLTVKLDSSLPAGVAGATVGLPGMAALRLPGYYRVARYAGGGS